MKDEKEHSVVPCASLQPASYGERLCSLKPDPVSRVVESLRSSVKYRYLCEATLTRMARWALERHASPKDAAKAAKSKLHQVYGAYMEPGTCERVARGVAALPEEELRVVCRRIMESHASTRERLADLEEIGLALADLVKPQGPVLDLACGLNPFALPWMNLSPELSYYAWDIDARLIGHIDTFLAGIGCPGEAVCRDVLAEPPDVEADVVLLLKALPCLEQQEAGASLRLLRGLSARVVVVSFPSRSLGGRGKGMADHYGAFMQGICGALDIEARILMWPSETFYILQR